MRNDATDVQTSEKLGHEVNEIDLEKLISIHGREPITSILEAITSGVNCLALGESHASPAMRPQRMLTKLLGHISRRFPTRPIVCCIEEYGDVFQDDVDRYVQDGRPTGVIASLSPEHPFIYHQLLLDFAHTVHHPSGMFVKCADISYDGTGKKPEYFSADPCTLRRIQEWYKRRDANLHTTTATPAQNGTNIVVLYCGNDHLSRREKFGGSHSKLYELLPAESLLVLRQQMMRPQTALSVPLLVRTGTVPEIDTSPTGQPHIYPYHLSDTEYSQRYDDYDGTIFIPRTPLNYFDT